MTSKELKEEIIAKIINDPKIWRALEIKYKDNAQVQRQAKEVYAEVISRLCKELDK